MNFIDVIRRLFNRKKEKESDTIIEEKSEIMNYNDSIIGEKDGDDDLIDLPDKNSEDTISTGEDILNNNYTSLLNNYKFVYLIEKFLKIQLRNKTDLNIIPSSFLDKCLDSNFLEYLESIIYLLDETIFYKIVNNKLSINDLSYKLLKLCEFVDLPIEEKEVYEILKSRKKLNIYFKDCAIIDMHDDFKIDEKEYEVMTDTYIPNVKILFNKIKYCPLGDLYSDAEIKVINPIDVKSDLFSKGYILGDNLINDESIIIVSLKKYIELCKNKKKLDIFSKHQFIISDNIDEKLSLPNDLEYIHYLNFFEEFISYELKDNIKNNHLLKVINDSELSENEKAYYCYIITNDSNKFRFSFENLIIDIIKKIGLEKIISITNEFNLMPINEKIQPINNLKYSIKVFLYTYPDFFKLDKETQVNILLNLSKKEFQEIIKEEVLLNFLFENNVNSYNDLIKLKELLNRISKIKNNETILEFLDKHNIDASEFIQNGNGILKSDYELNPIVARYRINYESISKKCVSLVDIVGFPHEFFRGQEHNILDIMENLYDKNGDGYHVRSISMIEYMSGETAMNGLMNTFFSESLGLDEIDGRYIVSENGRHRFAILRFLYERELFEGKLTNEELREKYMIPNCKVNICDYNKTYLNYLYHILDSSVYLVFNIYNKNEETNDKLQIRYHNGNVIVVSIQELKTIIDSLLDNIDSYDLNRISENYFKYSSFKDFMDNNFPNFKKIIDERENNQDGKSVRNM